MVLHRLSEDKLVEELDDQFVVLAGVGELDRAEGFEPILELLEEGAIQVGPRLAVFRRAEHVQQAARFQGTFE